MRQTPPSLLFLQIAQVILACLCHHMNFKISLSSFRRISAGILIGITLSLWISLKKIGIFITPSLPTNAHCRVSQFWSSFMSFRDILWFSLIQSWHFLISVFLSLLQVLLSTENRTLLLLFVCFLLFPILSQPFTNHCACFADTHAK